MGRMFSLVDEKMQRGIGLVHDAEAGTGESGIGVEEVFRRDTVDL